MQMLGLLINITGKSGQVFLGRIKFELKEAVSRSLSKFQQ